MKLSALKSPKSVSEPLKTKDLVIKLAYRSKELLSFIVVIRGIEKEFSIKNHNYLLTFKKVERYVEKNLK